jgi:hypothetical protein
MKELRELKKNRAGCYKTSKDKARQVVETVPEARVLHPRDLVQHGVA